eukprot:TRINITY_DN39566_c0_g1_i1.p1 TRINITY_DN39566_c0_g1~~TRINITY_DN39566_c0_g1_i1.p1  ORF type:complete len:639 (+),score=117.23 TRINITY_DN39566_c0_g1_i1:247-2163(+)
MDQQHCQHQRQQQRQQQQHSHQEDKAMENQSGEANERDKGTTEERGIISTAVAFGEMSSQDVETKGVVVRFRRLGCRLSFVVLDLVGDDQQFVFDSREFGTRGDSVVSTGDDSDPFPARKGELRVGDLVWLRGTVQQDTRPLKIFVRRWRLLARDQPISPEVRKPSEGCATLRYVRCPLCPPGAEQRYRFPMGFRNHLESIHVGRSTDDPGWERAQEEAARLGVFGARTAVGARLMSKRGMRNGTDRTGADVAYTSQEGIGGAALHPGIPAARDGNITSLEALLKDGWKPLAVSSLDRHGASALDFAAGSGHVTALSALLPAALASGQRAGRRDGRTPLHWAARKGHADAVRFLLALPQTQAEQLLGPGGPDISAAEGTTPLMLAAFGNHVEVAKLLASEEYGADLTRRNGWGCDVTHFAAMGDAIDTCRWLAALRDDEGHAAISFAREQKEGHTALHKAAMKGAIGVCRFLIDEGGLLPAEAQAIRLKHAAGIVEDGTSEVHKPMLEALEKEDEHDKDEDEEEESDEENYPQMGQAENEHQGTQESVAIRVEEANMIEKNKLGPDANENATTGTEEMRRRRRRQRGPFDGTSAPGSAQDSGPSHRGGWRRLLAKRPSTLARKSGNTTCAEFLEQRGL